MPTLPLQRIILGRKGSVIQAICRDAEVRHPAQLPFVLSPVSAVLQAALAARLLRPVKLSLTVNTDGYEQRPAEGVHPDLKKAQ